MSSSIDKGAVSDCLAIIQQRHDTMPRLQEKLAAVRGCLSRVGLAHVVPFAVGYENITGASARALGNDFFADPVMTERLSCGFADLYLDPLAERLGGDERRIPRAWQQLFAQSLAQPAWYLLALGLNVHIRRDLPIALRSVNPAPPYKNDFFRVNDIIRSEAPGYAPSYLDTYPVAEQCITALATRLIVRWRRGAWADFERLGRGEIDEANLDGISARKGKLLHHLARVSVLL